MEFLFEFTFERFNIKSHLIEWCKNHQIDYITGHLGCFYADVYGTGEYYCLRTESVGNNVFEVYADKTDTIVNNDKFSRIYPQVKRAIKIDYPVRKIELVMADGKENIKTEVALPSLVAKRDYIGRVYSRDNKTCHVVDVKIVA